MTPGTLQLNLDLAPSRPRVRLADPAPTPAAARALQRRTPSGPVRPGPAGGRLTLDDVVVGVWEGLLARRTVRCLVCGADAMQPAHDGAPGGHCGACHSQLS